MVPVKIKKYILRRHSLINSENNFPFIEKLVFDPDESVRRNTIGVIGNFIENERYVDLLQKILKDDNIPHEALKVIKG